MDEPRPTRPETALAISYVGPQARPGLAALMLLDETLGGLVRAAREPIVAQMRLTWWHDALGKLDDAKPPAQPVLTAIAEMVGRHGVTGASLTPMIDGWEALLDEPIDADAVRRHAELRGGTLFAACGAVLGEVARSMPLADAGAGWAAIDLARNVRDPKVAAIAHDLARARLAKATQRPWPGEARSIGALVMLARRDAFARSDAFEATAAPARVLRMAWHRLTGR